jgi:hypothetical protein
VAAAARRSFALVFSTEQRQRKTLAFCGVAIAEYAANMLLQQTAETLCDGQPSSSDVCVTVWVPRRVTLWFHDWAIRCVYTLSFEASRS